MVSLNKVTGYNGSEDNKNNSLGAIGIGDRDRLIEVTV